MDQQTYKKADNLNQKINSDRQILQNLNEIIETGEISRITIITPITGHRYRIKGEREGKTILPLPVDEPLMKYFKRCRNRIQQRIKESEKKFETL